MKKTLCLLLAVFLFLPTACIQKKEHTIVKGIGFDMQGDSFLLTASAALSEDLYRSVGETPACAIEALSACCPAPPDLKQNELILLSGTLPQVKTRSLCLSYFSRDKRKGSEYLLCTDASAESIFRLAPAENILRQMRTASQNGFTIPCTLSAFIAASEGLGASALLPVVAAEENSLRISGAALYKAYRRMANLDREMLRAALLFLGEGENLCFPLICGGESYDLRITAQKSELGAELHEEKLHFSLASDLCLTLISRSGIGGEAPDTERLRHAAAVFLEKELQKVFSFAQKYRADFLNLAARCLNTNSSLFKQLSENWEDHLAAAELHTEIRCQVNVSGIITKPEVPEE